ncbi:MAG: HAD family hydrolase [Planctomycetota bacterium]|jgi:FMN phosphatase YigB (HAD superfamily)
MQIESIVFDFGNTLLPWGADQGTALLRAVEAAFTEVLGPQEGFLGRAHESRDRLIREGENGSMREVTCEEFVTDLFGAAPPDGLVDAVAASSHRAFVDLCALPPGRRQLLERLGERYPLAVLSNFFLAGPVEEVLQRDGLWDLFVHVEVSAVDGWMKPHPAPFDAVRERLGTPMERTLMVGDDFFADIVGGHRAGMLTALTREWRDVATHDPRAPEIRADRILESLDELLD